MGNIRSGNLVFKTISFSGKSDTTIYKAKDIIAGKKLQNNMHASCCCQVASVVSDSVRPHRRQPTRLLCPWDSLGKNTGVGCHFLLQNNMHSMSLFWLSAFTYTCVLCSVARLCLTLWDPTDCIPPGSSVHGISQARILEQVAISYTRGSSQPRDPIHTKRCEKTNFKLMITWLM